MKTATVRDLRYDFPKLEAWLAGEEEILITKHSKVVAKISRATEPTTTELPPHPNYEARRKRIWGDRIFTQAEVDDMRAFETSEP
jgi:antitoxin (DNA-binding transcriptional repressor) of toxin-antitoxin stability system